MGTKQIIATLALLVTAHLPVAAQDADQDDRRWSVGAGASILTGTPHRPRPPEGDGLTGASGPEQGFHVRAGVEQRIRPWLYAGLEASYNRLTTSVRTFNCISDVGSDSTGTCYPAAGEDELLAGLATVRAHTRWPLAPFATIGFGAGAYGLRVDEPFEDSPDLEDRTGVRPVTRIGVGLSHEVADGYRLSLEAGLNATLGRHGGTHHIPVVLSVSF